MKRVKGFLSGLVLAELKPQLVRVLMGLVLTIAPSLAWAQQPSLGEVAAKEEERRQSISEPSKVYTVIDPAPATARIPATRVLPSSCQSEKRYDSQSGNVYVNLKCPDGTTVQVGTNSRTGANWQTKYFPDGSMEGTDSCGNRWTYDARTTLYVNENGEQRRGIGDLRQQLQSPAACKANATNTEAYWRGRITSARDGLARARTFAEALQARIEVLSAWPCPPERVSRCEVLQEDPAERAVIDDDLQKALAEMERVRAEIQQYQEAINDIEAEARRANVLPGWLR